MQGVERGDHVGPADLFSPMQWTGKFGSAGGDDKGRLSQVHVVHLPREESAGIRS